jgi:hypothetical protein
MVLERPPVRDTGVQEHHVQLPEMLTHPLRQTALRIEIARIGLHHRHLVPEDLPRPVDAGRGDPRVGDQPLGDAGSRPERDAVPFVEEAARGDRGVAVYMRAGVFGFALDRDDLLVLVVGDDQEHLARDLVHVESGGEGVSVADVGEGEGRLAGGVLEPVTGRAHRAARVPVP